MPQFGYCPTAVLEPRNCSLIAFNRPTYEVDVFENRGSAWLLISHTALGVPQ
jgi:hypothetical protein